MIEPFPDPRRVLTNFVSGDASIDPHLTQEWLVTNGMGGYASGSVLGPITRRYHGLLIAALEKPAGRFMMLHGLSERFRMPDQGVLFAGPPDFIGAAGKAPLAPVEFRLECGLPVWIYDLWGNRIEKRILLPYKQNTVHIAYRYTHGSGSIRLGLRPGMHLRNHNAEVNKPVGADYVLRATGLRLEISGRADLPVLRLQTAPHAGFTYDPKNVTIDYLFESHRGYPAQGELWSPGYFRTDLEPGAEIVLTASTEPWEIVESLAYEETVQAELTRRRSLIQMAAPQEGGLLPELVLAADQFLIAPQGRYEETARARAAGDEPLTVIAGYHWFTDWGRDTMISLEGLTLRAGRHQEASWILRTFAHYVRDGLIPNLFPEGKNQGLYHTADASLWFFHALSRYLEATNDQVTLCAILPKLHEIANAHIAGTRFGIHVDPRDGLLVQGETGYQLTWMDAKVDDWVVTPRRGKAVEINALWYNALCLLSNWVEQESGPGAAATYREYAQRARESFNGRFWNPERGYLFDVVDGESGGGKPGNDPSCRPNQLLAISLPNPVLDEAHWAEVVDAATQFLLTPVGLRSLAPFEAEYKKRYDGDLRSRDAAYHQGSVWGWLIGPYVDALSKVHPERCSLDLLRGFERHLNEACVGSISEIFDAEEPHTPRGCIAQAWSVAEVLRCWVKLAGIRQAAEESGELSAGRR
ncbi:MAG TPA: amylo-alpha-1,6-glucosidase [Bryobacteraceae bacterium]|nr:amylo-alpha-1,6-glucosidase [Bryobacteraceae bacterium]